MKTLPEWMLLLGVSIDRARKILRARPDLKALGTQHGPTRTYTEAEARQVAEAVRAIEAKRAGRSAAAV